MLNRSHIDTVVRAALDEDAPWGDLTSTTLIPADAAATASAPSPASPTTTTSSSASRIIRKPARMTA